MLGLRERNYLLKVTSNFNYHLRPAKGEGASALHLSRGEGVNELKNDEYRFK